jgi:hypothetical protein
MKDIKGYEGVYAITRDGRVWRYPKKGLFLKLSNMRGYERAVLWDGKKRRDVSVHRLVAETFIENPRGVSEVNHKNGIKNDNRVENLEWCTSSENSKHAFAKGLRRGRGGVLCNFAKLSEEDVKEILRLLKQGVLQKVIAEQFNVGASAISLIKTGQNWKHLSTA